MSASSTNCKNAQWTFKNKQAIAIGVARVARGKLRRRLCKRIRQINSAGGGGHCRAIWRTGHAAERANDKLMPVISEVMSFICSDSSENGIRKEKCLQNGQANHLFQSINHLFQSILGPKAMHWKFQSVKCLDKPLCMMEEKKGVEEQNSEKELGKNEHACRVEGVFCSLGLDCQ